MVVAAVVIRAVLILSTPG